MSISHVRAHESPTMSVHTWAGVCDAEGRATGTEKDSKFDKRIEERRALRKPALCRALSKPLIVAHPDSNYALCSLLCLFIQLLKLH